MWDSAITSSWVHSCSTHHRRRRKSNLLFSGIAERLFFWQIDFSPNSDVSLTFRDKSTAATSRQTDRQIFNACEIKWDREKGVVGGVCSIVNHAGRRASYCDCCADDRYQGFGIKQRQQSGWAVPPLFRAFTYLREYVSWRYNDEISSSIQKQKTKKNVVKQMRVQFVNRRADDRVPTVHELTNAPEDEYIELVNM